LGKLRLARAKVDLGRGVVERTDGGSERLTSREAELLGYLAERSGEVVTREQLLRDLWGAEGDVVSRTPDTTIDRLRAKIEADRGRPDHIVSIADDGWTFVFLPEPSLAPTPVPARGALPPGPRASNLVQPPDGFVGRDAEAAALQRWWDGGARLVTLIGPAGAGKTSLARRFAWEHRADLSGGAWFCDLGRARSADDVALVVAAARGLRIAAGADLVTAVGEALASAGPTLLVLDNFEGIVQVAGPAVGAWLDAAPALRVVVTSQAPLRAVGEEWIEVGALSREDGVALFENRARAAAPGFVVTAEVRPTVDAIVERLDGLPLGIELAAARMDALTPATLLERLDHRFSILAGARPEGSARHATLQDAIDWSWSLLSPREQSALAQCSVFASSFEVEAVEAVLQLDEGAWPLDVVAALRERSLLRQADGRFTHFESIREFADARLEGDLRAAAQRRHAMFYVERGTALALRLTLLGGGAWADQLRLELGHLRAVVDRFADTEPLLAARAIAAIHALLKLRGPAAQHREFLSRGIDLAADDEALQLQLLEDLAWAQLRVAQLEDAAATLERARSLRGGSLHPGIRLAQGVLVATDGSLDEGERHFTAAWQMTQGRGDPLATARVLAVRGRAHLVNFRLGEAEELLEEAARGFREAGARGREARCFDDLSDVLLKQDDLAAAAQYNHWATELHDELGAEWELALDLLHGGIIAIHDRRFDDGAASLRRALVLARRVGHDLVVKAAQSRLSALTEA